MSSLFPFQSSYHISSDKHDSFRSSSDDDDDDVIVCRVLLARFSLPSRQIQMGLIRGRVPLVSCPAVTSALQLFSSSVSCPPAQRGLRRRGGGALNSWLDVTLTKPHTPMQRGKPQTWTGCSTLASVSQRAFCLFHKQLPHDTDLT